MEKEMSFTILLSILLFFGTAFSQTINKSKLDSLFNKLAENNKAMGSIAVSKNGTIVYSRAIGYSFIAGKEQKPATENTRYRIGSISKMFTAVMIFQLIEEHKLELSSTLNKFYPAIPNADKITIGNLLNHRSGLHNFTNDSNYITYMTKPKSESEMVAIIAANKPDFQPGEKTAYSNSNFVLLGFIIEKITKQTYSKALTDRITRKTGLSNTYYGSKTNPAHQESFSYTYLNGWQQQPETDMSIPGGAGAIVSTPEDLTKFIEALFAFMLIKSNSLVQMKTITDGLGMGMFQIPFYNRKAYGHNGRIDGFESSLGYFPEDSVAIAYCTNGQVYPLNDILLGVLSIVFNRADYIIPTFKAFQVTSEALEQYPGIYSSTKTPLKITIVKTENGLTAQATEQSAFPLEATAKDQFKFEQAGIVIEFNPVKSEMILKQAGAAYLFTKDK